MALFGLTIDETLQLATAPLVSWAQLSWFNQVNHHVTEPYLDEVFHIPQANAFWHGNWSHWDDKITTPPGLYVYSILTSNIFSLESSPGEDLSPLQLRWTNLLLVYLLVFACVLWKWTASSGPVSGQSIFAQQLCILAFPLFFFFSALYYTDLFAAFTVMCSYTAWQAGLRRQGYRKFIFQLLHLFSGLASLTSRQTNIFWSAIFIGGLQVVHTIKQTSRIHDPAIADAYFEDFPIMIISLASSALNTIPQLLIDLWPHLSLVAVFSAFVIWNGGVVLGDKSNHVAGLHLPQMLYFWPFLVFFSWPLILPQIAHLTQLPRYVPRLWLSLVLMVGIAAMVHLNTVVHPFLLADNRHYTFYVFKLLRSWQWSWYAMVPIYLICAWLSIHALGSRMTYSGGPGIKGSRGRRLSTSSGKGDVAAVEADSNRTSFVLIWSLSTALSLITAPLVEPRYFIIPWLIWRLHIPHPADVLKNAPLAPAQHVAIAKTEDILTNVARRSLLLELAWYMAVNMATCRLFLYNGFQWPQQPETTQRFMW